MFLKFLRLECIPIRSLLTWGIITEIIHGRLDNSLLISSLPDWTPGRRPGDAHVSFPSLDTLLGSFSGFLSPEYFLEWTLDGAEAEPAPLAADSVTEETIINDSQNNTWKMARFVMLKNIWITKMRNVYFVNLRIIDFDNLMITHYFFSMEIL